MVSSTSQLLIYPQYGDSYDNNQNCQWTLTSSDPDSRIQIDFEHFDTETNYDYLVVRCNLSRYRYAYRLKSTFSALSQWFGFNYNKIDSHLLHKKSPDVTAITNWQKQKQNKHNNICSVWDLHSKSDFLKIINDIVRWQATAFTISLFG